jgi:hypothetical protein
MVCLATAVVAALSCSRRLAWAWRAVAAYGLAAAILILSIAPALDLPPEGRMGLWLAAAGVFFLAAFGAWHLRRSVQV